METLVIGGDLKVARLGYGAMRITGPGIWGPPVDRKSALAVLRALPGLGVNFIDTADSYGPDVSEELIAEALHPYPANLVIATKGGLVRPVAESWDRDGRPQHLVRACEGSLRRLKRDRIDLYQLHAPDPRVPFAESVGALGRLREQGKIRHIGLSNVSVPQIEAARRIAPIVAVQNRYNLGDRASDEVIDYCTREKLAFLPWYPLGGWGLPGDGAQLGRVAKAQRATPFQVAIAWLLARAPVMLPIPGTTKVEHLRENVAAAELRLSREELRSLVA